MKRFLTGLLILVLAMGLLAGCNAAESATEPMGNAAHGEDGQKDETPDKEAAEETFVIPTGIPYQGKVYEFCLFHDGVLYVGERFLSSLPEEAVMTGRIRSMDNDAIPDEEMESSQRPAGMKVYSVEEGKSLLVKYDVTNILKMIPYTGNTDDLFIPGWERETSAVEETEADIARLTRAEIPAERLFTIALYPDVDRDFVIQQILDQYNVILVLEGLAEKSFAVYTKDLLSEEEAWDFMTEIALEGGVLSIERPQTALEPGKNEKTFPGQKISLYKYGPEMIAAEDSGNTNPWVEYKTLEDAEKTVGFTFEIPENNLQKIYRTMGKEIIEVIFLENGEEMYRLRKGVGYGNLSGDGREFKRKGAGNLGGLNIFTSYGALEGDAEGTYRLAYRAYKDYSYSASVAETAMTGDEIVKLFPDDKHTRPEWEEIQNSRDLEWYLENYKEGVTVLELPDEVMTKPPLAFPRQGEYGQKFSPDTLTLKLDTAYDKETVIRLLLSKFPVELKYAFRLDSALIAIRTTETLTDEEFAGLAAEIYAMKGIVGLSRDMVNQPDNPPVETGVSDI